MSLNRQAFFYSLIFFAVAIAAGIFIFSSDGSLSITDAGLTLGGGLGAMLSAWIFYRIILRSGKTFSLLLSFFAGIIISILAHPFAWYLMILFAYFAGQRDSLGQLTMNPWEGLVYLWGYVLTSLLFFGWLTALFGVGGGSIAFLLQKRISAKKTDGFALTRK